MRSVAGLVCPVRNDLRKSVPSFCCKLRYENSPLWRQDSLGINLFWHPAFVNPKKDNLHLVFETERSDHLSDGPSGLSELPELSLFGCWVSCATVMSRNGNDPGFMVYQGDTQQAPNPFHRMKI